MLPEHPFAQYVRILGKGRKGSRNFTMDEAEQVMSMIMANEVTPEQLGAILTLMRVKEETPEEVAGFVKAIRKSIYLTQPLPENAPVVDVDWSSYAGKRRHLPWYILSAQLLAENNIKIFMHGAGGHTEGRIYTKDVLQHLGIDVSTSLLDASEKITRSGFAYLDMGNLSPRLQEIIDLRRIIGLRSPVHTVARLLNPFNAAYVITGIHHPAYHPMHQQASLLLNHEHAAVVKGEGGEIERNPDMECLVKTLHGTVLEDEKWPAMFTRRHVKPENLDPGELASVWRGESDNEYGIAAITGTTAIVLKLLGKADSFEGSEELAKKLWNERNRNRISAAA